MFYKLKIIKNQERENEEIQNTSEPCICFWSQSKMTRIHFSYYFLREYLIKFVQSDGNLCRLKERTTKFVQHFRSTSRFSRKLLTRYVGCTLYDTAWVRCKAPKCIVNYALCKMYLSLTLLHFPHINTDAPPFFSYPRTYTYRASTGVSMLNRVCRLESCKQRHIHASRIMCFPVK